MSGDSGSKRPTRPRFHKAYSFGLVTGAFFLLSWLGQFLFQMVVVRNESEQHGQSFTWSDFLPQFFSSTLENWQSEFLQLVWQAAGLALFYFWGSSQSKESDDRLEAKIDALLESAILIQPSSSTRKRTRLMAATTARVTDRTSAGVPVPTGNRRAAAADRYRL